MKNYSSVVEAVKAGERTTLSSLIENNPQIIYQNDPETGDSILHVAVRNGRYVMVKFLLETQKFDVNRVNNKKETPLHVSAEQENSQITVSLINSGADVRLRDDQGFTPLHRAAKLGHFAVTQVLIERDSNADALVSILKKREFTPLFLVAAFRKGRPAEEKSVVEMLLRKNVDVNKKPTGELSPIELFALKIDQDVQIYSYIISLLYMHKAFIEKVSCSKVSKGASKKRRAVETIHVVIEQQFIEASVNTSGFFKAISGTEHYNTKRPGRLIAEYTAMGQQKLPRF